MSQHLHDLPALHTPITRETARRLLDDVSSVITYTLCDHGPAEDRHAASAGRQKLEILGLIQRPGRFCAHPSVMGARKDSGIEPRHARIMTQAPKLARAYLNAEAHVDPLERLLLDHGLTLPARPPLEEAIPCLDR